MIEFKKGVIYKLHSPHDTTFTGRLGASITLKKMNHGEYLTGVDQNGVKCLLPVNVIDDKMWQEINHCDPCGVVLEYGTEPDSDGQFWCPCCDQAGANPSC